VWAFLNPLFLLFLLVEFGAGAGFIYKTILIRVFVILRPHGVLMFPLSLIPSTSDRLLGVLQTYFDFPVAGIVWI
jgi:hypothetical protein